MNIFAIEALNSPALKSSHALLRYLVNHGTGPEMLNFYIFIAIGCVAAIGGERLTVLGIRRAMRQSPKDIVDKVAEAVRMPLCLIIFSYFFIVGFDAIKSMPSNLWMHVHENLYPIFNGLLVLVCAFRLVDLISQILRRRWQSDTVQLDERWADLIGLFGKVVVIIGTGLFLIEKLMPSFNILPILTGLSFVGAAIALASQKTIANAIGSMEIMIDRLFKEGDRISFGEYDGFVTRMGLRSITLTALTGEKINLPNKDLVDKQIRNFTQGKFVGGSLAVGIVYDADRALIEKAMGLLESIARAHPKIDSATSRFTKLGDSALELKVFFLADYKTGGEYGAILSDLHLAVKEAFDREGIAFAFPTQTVYQFNQEPAPKPQDKPA